MSTAVKKKVVKKKMDVVELRFKVENDLKEILTIYKDILKPDKKDSRVRKCVDKLNAINGMVMQLTTQMERLNIGSHLIDYYYDLNDCLNEYINMLEMYGYAPDDRDYKILTYEQWKDRNGF